jgi:AraC-like DNA-binding protein
MNMQDGESMIIKYTCAGPQPGFMRAEEARPNYVMLGVEEGTFDFSVGSLSGRSFPGDLVFCPPGVVFKRKSLGSIAFHVFEFVLQEESNGLLMGLPVGKVTVSDIGRLTSTYTCLRRTWQEHGYHSRKMSYTSHMLLDLLYMSDRERHLAQQRTKHVDPLVERALALIHQHLFDEVSMQQIAGDLGILPSEFTRRFRYAYGMTPMEYTTQKKLEKAKRLLRETNETLELIAGRCGYENGAYLSRVFRAKTGMTPSSFRKNHQF